jgi:hypothetical protein
MFGMVRPERNLGLTLCLFVALSKSSLNIQRKEAKHGE